MIGTGTPLRWTIAAILAGTSMMKIPELIDGAHSTTAYPAWLLWCVVAAEVSVAAALVIKRAAWWPPLLSLGLGSAFLLTQTARALTGGAASSCGCLGRDVGTVREALLIALVITCLSAIALVRPACRSTMSANVGRGALPR